uniref:Uncharacterized protein n=1 Tax=Arundo donax TaxID=35708 RepID=A0A0A9E3M7_ARUDO
MICGIVVMRMSGQGF